MKSSSASKLASESYPLWLTQTLTWITERLGAIARPLRAAAKIQSRTTCSQPQSRCERINQYNKTSKLDKNRGSAKRGLAGADTVGPPPKRLLAKKNRKQIALSYEVGREVHWKCVSSSKHKLVSLIRIFPVTPKSFLPTLKFKSHSAL